MPADRWPGISPAPSLPTSTNIEDDGDHDPTLPQLYNALAQRFLDSSCYKFRQYLLVQLAYLYMDCPDVASKSFVEHLPNDIRQFHLDMLSETLYMQTDDTIKHEKRIRERARNNDWELMYEGSAALGGMKIDREYETKLRAMLPPVPFVEAVCIYSPSVRLLVY